jgi:hypothetical protein
MEMEMSMKERGFMYFILIIMQKKKKLEPQSMVVGLVIVAICCHQGDEVDEILSGHKKLSIHQGFTL